MESWKEQNDVLFPSVDEIKSYFPEDVWSTMADYERSSYRNILHNYNVMKSLDLKPTKPSFMVLYPKKTLKRKAVSNPCPIPAKKPELKKEKPSKVVADGPLPVKNSKSSKVVKEQKKANPAMFNDSHRLRSINLHCVFTAVFKVYKRYHGVIKGHYLNKNKSHKIPKTNFKKKVENDVNDPKFDEIAKDSHEGNVNISKSTEKNIDGKSRRTEGSVVLEKTSVENPNKPESDKSKSDEKCSKNNSSVVAAQDIPLKLLEEIKKSNDVKKEDCVTQVSRSAVPQTKPVCRSVQTMTVAVGCSPSSTPLVFVNAASSKKLSIAFPDPKPLTPQEQRRMKKINQEKMKNRRNVQTQTAAEDSFIETAKLVFFPVPKPKKPGSKPSSTQANNYEKEKLLDTKTKQDKISAENPDSKQSVACPPLARTENDEIAKPSGNDEKEKYNDASSEDEFGFYDLFKQENDAKTKNDISAKPDVPEIKPQPGGSDSAAPGCSGMRSGRTVAERRYPRRAVPVIDYTEGELLQDDEYLFCDLCDREYEGDCPEHGPHKYFPDRFAPVTGDGDRAIQTTPAMLKIDKSKIPGAGSGVWTMLGLPPHVRFGPYQGDETSEPDPLGYSWAIVRDKRVNHYIAAQSTATSNWMRFVNCARHETEQNLMAFQYKGQMYYRTVKLIPPKAELFVWYGKEYAELLGISMESFRSKDTSHLRNLVFSCDKCNVTYTSPLYLEVHEKRCRGERAVVVEPASVPRDVQSLAVVVGGRKTYCCNICDYKTANSGNIKRHLVTHSGERPHVCDVCGKGFTCAGNLNKHKRIHTGDKPFKCTQCSYTSNQSSHIRVHMTCHTGEKVYACPECEYKTAYSSTMENHSRTHSGDKPYCCTLCPYRAAHSGHLTIHMRTHTGEKPYLCPYCGYAAAQKGRLNKHIASQHSAHE